MKNVLANFAGNVLSKNEMKALKGGNVADGCGGCRPDQQCYDSVVFIGTDGTYFGEVRGVTCASSLQACETIVRRSQIQTFDTVDAHCC